MITLTTLLRFPMTAAADPLTHESRREATHNWNTSARAEGIHVASLSQTDPELPPADWLCNISPSAVASSREITAANDATEEKDAHCDSVWQVFGQISCVFLSVLRPLLELLLIIPVLHPKGVTCCLVVSVFIIGGRVCCNRSPRRMRETRSGQSSVWNHGWLPTPTMLGLCFGSKVKIQSISAFTSSDRVSSTFSLYL